MQWSSCSHWDLPKVSISSVVVLGMLILHLPVITATVFVTFLGESEFYTLLDIWFPDKKPLPTAFLVDTSEEALLLPDWLKLRMIRSEVSQLVDAGINNLYLEIRILEINTRNDCVFDFF